MDQKVILFQGDSITDCGRDKEKGANNGRGYAHLVSAHLMFHEPYQYKCINRGIPATVWWTCMPASVGI